MGTDIGKSQAGSDPDARLQRIQALLDQNEALRKKRSTTSMIGVLALLLVLGIFIYRLYDQGRSIVKQTPEIAKQVWIETEPGIKREAELLRKDLQEVAVPELSKAMIAAFRSDMPAFEKEAQEMGSRLYDHGRQTIEARLIETLSTTLDSSENGLKGVFPEFTPERLKKQMEASSNIFSDKAYDVIEGRIAKVGSSIEGLKSAVKKVAESSGSEHLSAERLDWAEDEVLNALVDLVVFELKPELGNELVPPAAPVKGGKK